jgi:Xaa-Pro aminopeptidase
METNTRLKKLRQGLTAKNLPAVLISQPQNRRYLTGSAGYLLITEEAQILATDFRYVEQAKKEAPGFTVFQIVGQIAEWFPRLVDGLNLTELAFEAQEVTFERYTRLQEITDKLAIKFTPITSLVEELRLIKEPGEISLIEKAIAISDAAMAYAADILQAGMTELALAWRIEAYMRENGSGALPFEVIVASGPNSALPHHQPGEKAILIGEPVIIDIGANFQGYASDLTRTLYIGEPDSQLHQIYNLVLEAQLAAEAGITSGLNGAAADNLARRLIDGAGYAASFGHGVGHGVGLEIHEAPRVGPGSTDILANGMVFTIEPGIYLPEWGGVRIEDTVTLQNGRLVVLSQANKAEAGTA